jgi:transcription elongation GreA/GreB family factor
LRNCGSISVVTLFSFPTRRLRDLEDSFERLARQLAEVRTDADNAGRLARDAAAEAADAKDRIRRAIGRWSKRLALDESAEPESTPSGRPSPDQIAATFRRIGVR